MKKTLALTLSVMLCLGCLGACDSFGHEHVKGEWRHSETEHWRLPECDREDCVVEDVVYDLGNHVDDDLDHVCDDCRFEIAHKHIEGEWAYDEEYHWRSHITCTWQTCDIDPALIRHLDENGDHICDDCGYNVLSASVDVAQIVLDYENEWKEEIERKREEHPEYHFYYYGVDRIECVFAFGGNTSADALIEKYDMKNVFACADVYAANAIKMISILFDRDELTEAMHQRIEQIKNEEPLIESLFILMARDWNESYMPKIGYYTDQATELGYEKAASVFNLPGEKDLIIRSKAEYDEYLNRLLQNPEYDYLTENLNNQKALYDETFFEENALIITRQIIRGSGSIELTVNNLYRSENKLYVVIKTDVPGVGTDDMQYTHFTLKVAKSEVANITEVITLE
jgi:hypothetical protein